MKIVPTRVSKSKSKASNYLHFIYLLSEIACCLQGPQGPENNDSDYQHSNVVENSSYTKDVLWIPYLLDVYQAKHIIKSHL